MKEIFSKWKMTNIIKGNSIEIRKEVNNLKLKNHPKQICLNEKHLKN